MLNILSFLAADVSGSWEWTGNESADLQIGGHTAGKNNSGLLWIWISIDISVDIHVRMSDLGHIMDISIDTYVINSN